MKTMTSPRDILEYLEKNTTFSMSYADGENIGGTLSDNYDYFVHIVKMDDDDDFWLYVDYVGDEEDDPTELSMFDVECETKEEVLESLQELEEILENLLSE